MNEYWIVHTNCDCCSSRTLKAATKWKFGPRCPSCKKILGIMQYSIQKIIKAQNLDHAFEIWRNSEK